MESYKKTDWENYPSKNSPISAENLNKIEQGIYDVTEETKKKMDMENPTGTGSFSMNRKAGSAVGNYSVAIGYECTASAHSSHAEGYSTTANGFDSHAEGHSTTANGNNGSHAEGNSTTANGFASHAEGSATTANGSCSHAEGACTIASGGSQHVQGKFNVEDTNDKYAHIVGGGTSNEDRKNIHTLDWEGNAVFAGDVTNGNGVTMDGLKTLIDELIGQVQALTAQLEALQTTS